jgi:intracellular sulfur oxidation DsrE/DsrF family protein|tara:strand:- start:1 stop:507 length:507 start_codon:yes stop_codon:yes gene_type:complete
MKIPNIITLSLSLILLTTLLFNNAQAEKPNDANALEGIETGKVIWDVTLSKPSRLLFVMKVIDETYQDLVKQNVTPDMVFTFHGRVLNLLSSQPLELDLDEEIALEELLVLIQTLSNKPGVKMESCSVASRILGIDNSTIISAVKPVGNTFVSMIGYQQKGYALIPIN